MRLALLSSSGTGNYMRVHIALALTLTALAWPVVILSAPADAFAQTNRGTISGTVVDATGGVLPGATVTVINAGTGAERQVITSASGTYTVIDLEPVSYRVVVE